MKETHEFKEERLRIQNGGLLRRGYVMGRDGREGLALMLVGTSKRKLKFIKIRDWPKSLTKFRHIVSDRMKFIKMGNIMQ